MKSLLALSFLVLAIGPAEAQTVPESRGVLIPDGPEPSHLIAGGRVSDRTGYPIALYYTDFRAAVGSPEDMAISYLTERGEALGVSDLKTLAHNSTLRTKSGYRVRFAQFLDGVRVYRSGMAISIGFDGAVHFVTNDYKPGLSLSGAAKTSSNSAIKSARAHVAFEGAPIHEEEELVLFANGGSSRLARRVQLITATGAWDILVDASSGQVFRAVPTA
ncbi:hypothetical protein JYT20_01420, partial [Rhodothermus sp. AH-315-K08]|nr:hypothetical protein [Rhodothermus sp. AH-315-K08]